MVARPAARIFDPTIHFLPWVLQPGLPSKNVVIGGKFAWLGVPMSAGASLKEAKDASVDRIRKGTAACALAGNTPQAKAALEALKVKEQAEMAKKIMDAAASGASIHMCVSVAPIPVGIPHGPGVVMNGSKTVLINKLPACRLGDEILEALGPKNFIMFGQPNVWIGDKPNTLFQNLMAAAAKALAALVNAATKVMALVNALITDPASLVAKLIQQAMKGAVNIANMVGHLLGLEGVGTRIKTIVKTIGKELNEALDAATKAAAEAAKDPASTASNIAKKAKQVLQDLRKGMEEAARKEEEKLRRKAENAQRLAEKASKIVDKVAEKDGLAGETARKLQEERDRLLRMKKNAEKMAEKGAQAAEEGVEQIREARQAAKEEVRAARQAAERQGKEAARKVAEMAQKAADGLEDADAPSLPHGHDHPEHAH